MSASIRFHIWTTLLLASGTASSSPFCDALGQVANHIQSDFAAIRGGQYENSDDYAATIKLPNARRCLVFDFVVAGYSCEWEVTPTTVSRAKQLVAEIVAATNQCVAPYALVFDSSAKRPTWRYKGSRAVIEVTGGDTDTVELSIEKPRK